MFACDQLAIKGPQDRWAPYTIIAGATLTIVGLALELADTVGAGLGRFPQSLWLTGLTALLAGAIAIGQAEILDSYRDLTSVVRWALGATITFSIALVLAAVVAIEQDASEEWTGLLVEMAGSFAGGAAVALLLIPVISRAEVLTKCRDGSDSKHTGDGLQSSYQPLTGSSSEIDLRR